MLFMITMPEELEVFNMHIYIYPIMHTVKVLASKLSIVRIVLVGGLNVLWNIQKSLDKNDTHCLALCRSA